MNIIYSEIQNKPSEECWCCKDGITYWNWASDDTENGPTLADNCSSFGGTITCVPNGSDSPC